MAEIRDVLSLDRDDLPDYSTIYKSFDRLKMWVWRALLRVGRQQGRNPYDELKRVSRNNEMISRDQAVPAVETSG